MPQAVGQRDPELRGVEPPAVDTRCFFGVRDAAARGHDVHAVGPKHRLIPETVVVDHFPFVQPRDRLQSDVRVRRHVEAAAGA